MDRHSKTGLGKTGLGKTGLAAAIVVAAVVLDQLSKWWAETELDDGSVIEVLPTLEFDLAYNSGFSFGTGGDFGPVIGVIVIGMCFFLSYLIATSTSRPRTIILAAILGGAIGNLIDRVFRAEDGLLSGEVVDFIDVTWYAVFNVADMFVVCGAIAFGVYEMWTGRNGDDATDSVDPVDDDDATTEAVDQPAEEPTA